jgi:hypothetical protein
MMGHELEPICINERSGLKVALSFIA